MSPSLNSQRTTKLIFVSLNISISFFGFLRSYIFLKHLDFYELGLVSIFQTMILMVGMVQIGILNGSYRAFSGHEKKHRETLNNFVFTFFLWTIIGTLGLTSLYSFVFFADQLTFFLLGTIAGNFSLIATYAMNTLLADQKIREVNIINIISNFLGYSSLALVYIEPIWGLASFIIQPLLFSCLALYLHKPLIPSRLSLSSAAFKYLLRLGFIPYLTSLFLYVNLQAERWTIVFSLGIEEFGHFYLAIAYASLFALFPTSINNLYFPRMVRANSQNQLGEFDRLLKNYTTIQLAYCVGAVLLTAGLAPKIIEFVFPQHLGNLRYVFYILPGLVAINMANPLLVYFNALIKLRPLLISYGVGTLCMIFILAGLYYLDAIFLTNIAIADSIVNTVIALAICLFYFVYRQKNKSGNLSRSSG